VTARNQSFNGYVEVETAKTPQEIGEFFYTDTNRGTYMPKFATNLKT
jgi:hypothetical protein